MIITHNLSAMQTNRHLNLANRSLSKSLEKLSSGYRINVGADDPSGLIISEQLRSQISGVNRAIQNTSEASNLIGLTEGALNEVNEILKKMRALAIHAANNGVTSPQQVEADQQEVDSGIATIQRIADTTRYSDQYVLNGSKQLVYDRTTQVKTTMDHTLIDVEGSRVDQIFKRAGVSMAFSYSGLNKDGYVNNTNQAKRAYFEADSVQPDPHNPGGWIKSESDVNENGQLTADQEFVLSGTKGTKLFKFTEGQTLGEIARSINNSKDSLGVGATLTFSANARIDQTAASTYTQRVMDWSGTNLTDAANSGITVAAAAGVFDDLLIPDPADPSQSIAYNTNATGFTLTGELTNPNELAAILGVTVTNPDPADPANNVGAALKDMHLTLVQPTAEGGQWTLSIGTSPGSSDLAEVVFYPQSDPTWTFGQGPLAGLTLDLGNVLARSTTAGATGPYTATIANTDIVFDTGTYTEKAGLTHVRSGGEVQIYGANINAGADGAKVTSVGVRNPDDFRVGNNTDGDGRVYAKVTKFVNDQDYEVEWYKDAACTMLIGSSPKPNVFSATNNSGISNAGLTIALTNNAQVGDVYTIGLVGQEFVSARDSDGVGGVDQPADFDVYGLGGWQGMSDESLQKIVMSGVKLGYNTSDTGQLYFKAEGPPEARVISVYTSADRTPESMVATGTANLSATGQRVIRLEEVTMPNGEKSGLNLTIPFADAVTSRGEETGQIDFTNVALRLYATEYGKEEYINLQNKSGTLFHEYRYADTLDRTYVQAGTTVRTYGQDAVLSLNGFPIRAKGVTANVTTADFAGKVALNAGVLGMTTLATAGYEVGSLYSRAGALQGIEENERKMRQIELAQGYEVVPPQTYVGDSKGMIAGLSSEGVPDTGEIQFDFSKIVTTGMSTAQIANLKAACDNGLRVEVAPGTTVDADGNTTSIKIAIYFTDKDGNEMLIDPSDGNTYNITTGFTAADFNDIPLSTLNSADGLIVPTTAVVGQEDYNILQGLALKGSSLTDASGISSAPRTMYSVDANLSVPNFNALTEVVTYATQARHNTTETMDNFIGGMQFQLGGNEGDQDRTVYSIPSMVMANLGRCEINGRVYTLQDVLGSSDASLIADPILAMQIIGQAVDDVSTLRGRLGAFQANTLQTNQNSLTVAVEMLAKTESAIRDADMAAESTEFTKNQILSQAGTAMLAQANQISQNVLQLLG